MKIMNYLLIFVYFIECKNFWLFSYVSFRYLFYECNYDNFFLFGRVDEV